MSNIADFIKDFVENRTSKREQGSVSVVGDKLYSYNTVIAEREYNYMLVNMTKYSPTTTVHQNLVMKFADNRELPRKVIIEHVPVGTQTLVGLKTDEKSYSFN